MILGLLGIGYGFLSAPSTTEEVAQAMQHADDGHHGGDAADGRYDDVFISNYATTRIKDVLGRVEGVGKVTIFGAKDFGMRVWLDPGRLKARGLTPDEVVNALREQNVQVAAGKIGEPPAPDGTNFEYTLTTLGRLSEVDGDTVTVESRWNVFGSVGHWGHIHQRTNVYQANITVEDIEGQWKLSGLEILEEIRL